MIPYCYISPSACDSSSSFMCLQSAVAVSCCGIARAVPLAAEVAYRLIHVGVRCTNTTTEAGWLSLSRLRARFGLIARYTRSSSLRNSPQAKSPHTTAPPFLVFPGQHVPGRGLSCPVVDPFSHSPTYHEATWSKRAPEAASNSGHYLCLPLHNPFVARGTSTVIGQAIFSANSALAAVDPHRSSAFRCDRTYQ